MYPSLSILKNAIKLYTVPITILHSYDKITLEQLWRLLNEIERQSALMEYNQTIYTQSTVTITILHSFNNNNFIGGF